MNHMLAELMVSKWLILALLPFALVVLFGGWLIYYTRGGRPLRIHVSGLGVSVEVDTNTNCPGQERLQHD